MIKAYKNCTCNDNKKKYLKGDWGWFKKTCGICVGHGWGTESFCGYTIRHKLRFLIGIHGQMQDGSYLFRFRKFNWLLNRLIGFKKIN